MNNKGLRASIYRHMLYNSLDTGDKFFKIICCNSSCPNSYIGAIHNGSTTIYDFRLEPENSLDILKAELKENHIAFVSGRGHYRE